MWLIPLIGLSFVLGLPGGFLIIDLHPADGINFRRHYCSPFNYMRFLRSPLLLTPICRGIKLHLDDARYEVHERATTHP